MPLIFIYSFALAPCAFLRIGSIFVAFITSPLTFNFPAMNSRCAFALPATSLPKSSSERDRVTAYEDVSSAMSVKAKCEGRRSREER